VNRPDQNETTSSSWIGGSKSPGSFRRLSEAVVLRYHEELSMEDVAQALEISVSGAKMRVHRGLKKLKDLLEKNQHENKNLASSAG
jgi:hypothetical protein